MLPHSVPRENQNKNIPKVQISTEHIHNWVKFIKCFFVNLFSAQSSKLIFIKYVDHYLSIELFDAIFS
jgi:hypothetical protein